jgi:hypothetical protein
MSHKFFIFLLSSLFILSTPSIKASMICSDILKQTLDYALPPISDWVDIHSYDIVAKNFQSYAQVARQWTPLAQEIFKEKYNFIEIYNHYSYTLKYKEKLVLNAFKKTRFKNEVQEIETIFQLIKSDLKSILCLTANQKKLLMNIWHSKNIKNLIFQNKYGQPWFILVEDIINCCVEPLQKKIITEHYRKDIHAYPTNRIGIVLFDATFPNMKCF